MNPRGEEGNSNNGGASGDNIVRIVLCIVKNEMEVCVSIDTPATSVTAPAGVLENKGVGASNYRYTSAGGGGSPNCRASQSTRQAGASAGGTSCRSKRTRKNGFQVHTPHRVLALGTPRRPLVQEISRQATTPLCTAHLGRGLAPAFNCQRTPPSALQSVILHFIQSLHPE